MSKKYQLDRKKFIDYYLTEVWTKIQMCQVTNDLIKGGEFILTAEDVLESLKYIDGKLVGKQGPVLTSECELTYGTEFKN